MAQPKDPPIAIRPGRALRERFDAYVKADGGSVSAVGAELLEIGLDVKEGRLVPEKPEKSKGAPAAVAANQRAEELNARRAAEDKARSGWFAPKGRSK